ncbi:nuclear protein DGCR14 [Cytidiella melzeri]|nr:nuclear protein DGCR14 [Cytidiella melzeri]
MAQNASRPGTPEPSATDVARSLNRQAILDEDEYTEALSHIIARDFFPSLLHLGATNEYLDALKSRDPELIGATVRRLEQLSTPRTARTSYVQQTPSQTPFGLGPSDTPLRPPRGEPPTKRARYDTNLSLDNFQARYTSEDNSSFTQILEEENRRRREKYSWAWDAQKKVQQQRDRMVEGRERLLIEASAGVGVREKFLIEAPTPAGLLTSGSEPVATATGSNASTKDTMDAKDEDKVNKEGKGKEVVQMADERRRGDEEVIDVMAPKKDTRAAGVDGWEFKARNALMFPPDADVSPYHPKPATMSKDLKPPPPKVIKYGNTRLPEQDDTPSASGSLSAPPSPTRSRIDAAIAGTPYRPKSPTINDFSLVPSIPSPTPSELGPAAVKQLMTWGTLNATPRVLSQSDDPAEAAEVPPPNTFQIAGPSTREQLSLRLSNKASKSLRAKAELFGVSGSRTPSSVRSLGGGLSKKGSMAPPSWTPRRAEGGLTPAAKRLLDRTTLGTAAARRAEVMGRQAGWEGAKAREQDLNRVRWTPTPSPVTRRG